MGFYIKVRSDGRIYQVAEEKLSLNVGDEIIVETDQCQEIARVVADSDDVKQMTEKDSSLFIIRKVSSKDHEDDLAKKAEAKQNLVTCQEIITKHDLPMSLIDADISLDGKKLTFYFFAPSRVDFRSLVSELASAFKKLIRLQQVGSRDRARATDGIGRCGEQFCCRRFLKGDLECVTTEMAYDQGLGQMGPNRVTGACGKLMCCLRYELDLYKKAKKTLPEIGTKFKTKKGIGVVVDRNLINKTIKIELENKTILEVTCP